jgi:hypothetical protein
MSTSPVADDTIALALGLEAEITACWETALLPVREAAALGKELVALARRRGLPVGGLRALTQRALGEVARPAAVDRWLERDPEVTALLDRIAISSAALDGLAARARIAARSAMSLAIAAPNLVGAARAHAWGRGPSPMRDELMRRLDDVPLAAKARAETVRSEAGAASFIAARAKQDLLDGLRALVRPATERTMKLCAVG